MKNKICDICGKNITEKEFKNNDGYCHNCFTKKRQADECRKAGEMLQTAIMPSTNIIIQFTINT